MKDRVIDSFSGDYDFLSNMFMCYVSYGGLLYRSSEAAFQAQKYPPIDRPLFTKMTGKEAKSWGRKVPLPEDWNDRRHLIMSQCVFNKFTQNKDLAARLLETEDALLIEGNTWGDTYWGVCNGVGFNNLGYILMDVRDQIREKYSV